MIHPGTGKVKTGLIRKTKTGTPCRLEFANTFQELRTGSSVHPRQLPNSDHPSNPGSKLIGGPPVESRNMVFQGPNCSSCNTTRRTRARPVAATVVND